MRPSWLLTSKDAEIAKMFAYTVVFGIIVFLGVFSLFSMFAEIGADKKALSLENASSSDSSEIETMMNGRFKVLEHDMKPRTAMIIEDSETGVQYYYDRSSYGPGFMIQLGDVASTTSIKDFDDAIDGEKGFVKVRLADTDDVKYLGPHNRLLSGEAALLTAHVGEDGHVTFTDIRDDETALPDDCKPLANCYVKFIPTGETDGQ